MKRLLATLAGGLLLYGGMALAVPRYFVEDSSNVIKSFTIDDDVVAPTGETAVDASVIEAAYTGTIYQGGTWVVTGGVGVYTPPTGIVTPIDSTTDIGGVQTSCLNMLDVFDGALEYIHVNRFAWTADIRAKAIEGIHWQIINSARIALNDTRTHARRQKFCEESASWPMGVNGNVREYVDAFAADPTGITLPTKDWSWVDPEADPFTRRPVSTAGIGFNSATNIENAPTTDNLIGRAWIALIP